MLSIIIALMAYQVLAPHAEAGTYVVLSDNGSIIRTDTRTGAMERCTIVGQVVTCTPILPEGR